MTEQKYCRKISTEQVIVSAWAIPRTACGYKVVISSWRPASGYWEAGKGDFFFNPHSLSCMFCKLQQSKHVGNSMNA